MRIQIEYSEKWWKEHPNTTFKDLMGFPTDIEDLAVCKIEDFVIENKVKIPDMNPMSFTDVFDVNAPMKNNYHIEYERIYCYKLTVVKDLQNHVYEERILNYNDVKSIKFIDGYW